MSRPKSQHEHYTNYKRVPVKNGSNLPGYVLVQESTRNDLNCADNPDLDDFDCMVSFNNNKIKKYNEIIEKQNEKIRQENKLKEIIEAKRIKQEAMEAMEANQIYENKIREEQFFPIMILPQPGICGQVDRINNQAWNPANRTTDYGKGLRIRSRMYNNEGANEGLYRTDQQLYTTYLPRRNDV